MDEQLKQRLEGLADKLDRLWLNRKYPKSLHTSAAVLRATAELAEAANMLMLSLENHAYDGPEDVEVDNLKAALARLDEVLK